MFELASIFIYLVGGSIVIVCLIIWFKFRLFLLELGLRIKAWRRNRAFDRKFKKMMEQAVEEEERNRLAETQNSVLKRRN